MHEATRRLLGVLLRHLDGFETNKRSVVIAATNRKEDLDPALLSRCALPLGLPFLYVPRLPVGCYCTCGNHREVWAPAMWLHAPTGTSINTLKFSQCSQDGKRV